MNQRIGTYITKKTAGEGRRETWLEFFLEGVHHIFGKTLRIYPYQEGYNSIFISSSTGK